MIFISKVSIKLKSLELMDLTPEIHDTITLSFCSEGLCGKGGYAFGLLNVLLTVRLNE